MLELLIFISGVIMLWRFSKSTKAIAEGAETKTQVWAESVIANATIERAENYKDWKAKAEGLEIISHEKFMQEMRGQ